MTGEFPSQGVRNAKNVSIWWRHHDDTGVCGVLITSVVQLLVWCTVVHFWKLFKQLVACQLEIVIITVIYIVIVIMLLTLSLLISHYHGSFCNWNNLHYFITCLSFLCYISFSRWDTVTIILTAALLFGPRLIAGQITCQNNGNSASLFLINFPLFISRGEMFVKLRLLKLNFRFLSRRHSVIWRCSNWSPKKCWAPFYKHGLTLTLAWISNYIHYEMWDEITYPFLNFNGATVEV